MRPARGTPARVIVTTWRSAISSDSMGSLPFHACGVLTGRAERAIYGTILRVQVRFGPAPSYAPVWIPVACLWRSGDHRVPLDLSELEFDLEEDSAPKNAL